MIVHKPFSPDYNNSEIIFFGWFILQNQWYFLDLFKILEEENDFSSIGGLKLPVDIDSI